MGENRKKSWYDISINYLNINSPTYPNINFSVQDRGLKKPKFRVKTVNDNP